MRLAIGVEFVRQVIDVITDVSSYVLPFELTEDVAREHSYWY
ncbi:MAG: hypothetical protein WBQ10_01895 [Terriglobales bacterium]